MSMFMNKFFGICAISAALCGGCSDPGNLDADSTANLQQKGGGWNPNGPDLVHGRIGKQLVQGIRVNRALGGSFIIGESGASIAKVDSTIYNGQAVSPFSLVTNQGFFHFAYGNGIVVDGKDAKGLTLNFRISLDGDKILTPVSLFVKDVGDSAYTAYGLHMIYYSYTDSSGTVVTQSLCKDSEGMDEPAVPVGGHIWNMSDGSMVVEEGSISLACQTAAVAGCMEYGYHPWDTHLECNDPIDPKRCHPANMWNILQVCTRLKRADYCGTGKSHTMSGTEIWPADWLIPTVTNDARVMMPNLEALWGQGGVSCVVPANVRHKELLEQDPDCHAQLYREAPYTMVGYKPICTWERPNTDILADSVLDPK